MNDKENVLAIRIKKLRTDLKLTQEELALKLGLKGKSSIANYEKGTITPSDEIKKKMCKIFNCTMDYLMGVSDYKNESDYFTINCEKTRKFIEFGSSEEADKVDFNELGAFIDELRNTPAQKIESSLQKYLSKYDGILKSELEQYIRLLYDYSVNFDNNTTIQVKIPVLGVVKAGYDYLAEENIMGYISVNDNSLSGDDFFALKVKGNSMEPIIFENDIAIIKKQSVFENGDIVVAIVNGDEATIKRGYKTDSGLLLQPANSSVEPLIFTKDEIQNIPVTIIGIVYNITRKFK